MTPERAGAGGQRGGIGLVDPESDEQSRRLGDIGLSGQDPVERRLQRTGIGGLAGEQGFEEWGDHGSGSLVG